MTIGQRADLTTKDTILKLLSDDELARVSSAEGAAPIPAGEEYVDLSHLERGVQRARDSATPMGKILPKSAVLPHTWTSVMAVLVDFNKSRHNLA